MSPHIWLIRHGETEWSQAGRHTGRTDIPLTEAGEEQAQAAGRALTDVFPALVLCSPLIRARRTAEIAGLTPDAFEDDLMEWDYGAWEGLTTAEIRILRGDPRWRVWDEPIPPGTAPGSTPGEQLSDVRVRVDRVIARCTPVLEAGRECVLVAHGHLLRILTATWLDLPPDAAKLFALEPGHRSSLGFEREQHVIMSWNA